MSMTNYYNDDDSRKFNDVLISNDRTSAQCKIPLRLAPRTTVSSWNRIVTTPIVETDKMYQSHHTSTKMEYSKILIPDLTFSSTPDDGIRKVTLSQRFSSLSNRSLMYCGFDDDDDHSDIDEELIAVTKNDDISRSFLQYNTKQATVTCPKTFVTPMIGNHTASISAFVVAPKGHFIATNNICNETVYLGVDHLDVVNSKLMLPCFE
jgi:hypothetical protein